MAMYSTAFDESGHPDDRTHLIVAGGIANINQWIHFEREWKGALAPFGVTIFHAADFYQRNNPKYKDNPFRRITDEEADELIQRLVGIICRRVEKTFSCTIPLLQYAAVNEKYLLAECFGYPYPSAARSCMNSVYVWAEQHSIDRNEILFFFEDGAKHKGQLLWLAEKDHFPTPHFPKKKEFYGLQMGDFLAWHQHAFIAGTLDEIGFRALQRLGRHSNKWTMISMFDDPDRVPAIFNIPKRDPDYHYKCKTVRTNSERVPLIHSWHKSLGPIDPKFDRQRTRITERPPMLDEKAFDSALAAYENAKRAKSEVP